MIPVSNIYSFFRTALKNSIVSWVGRIVLTAIFFVFVNRSVNITQVPALFSGIKVQYWFCIILIGSAGVLAQAKRWQTIVNYQKMSFTYSQALQTFLWGTTLAFLTPGRIGDLFRGVGVPQSQKNTMIIAAIIDRFYSFIITLVLGIVCYLVQIAVDRQWHADLFFSICIGSVCVILASLICVHYRRPFFGSKKIFKYALQCLDSLPGFFSRSGFQIGSWNLFAHSILIVQSVLVLSVLGIDCSVPLFFAFGKAYAFMLFAPFFIANIGIREFAFGLFLQQAFTGRVVQGIVIADVALSASLVIALCNVILPALAGLIWHFYKK